MPTRVAPPGLLGRGREGEILSGLVAAAKAGRSQVLVLRGEAGIGKTALLELLLAGATGCRVNRAAGVHGEMELAFAGLHQLCIPYLDRMNTLPASQRDALGTAFGLRSGRPPDRSLVGLAVLTLLDEVAGERPLICVVDDAQWLDQASAQTLELVARRLAAEPIAMVFAVGESGEDSRFAGLPELVVGGLDSGDAAALLDWAVTGSLDPRVRDRLLAESHGNPRALLEVPRALPMLHLAFGGAADADAEPLVQRLERGFLRQVSHLPEQCRRLLLVAAAEPIGDVVLLRRAADRLGMTCDAAAAAQQAGLLELRDRVTFRHPLIRSAVYRSAAPADRRAVHRALAEVTDPHADPDRRAWHRACAAVSPDEVVAAELERSAARAVARGGLAAAAAFLERAATLTPEPGRRVRRCLAAARAKMHAGAFADASILLASAQADRPLGDRERAQIDLLRAGITFAAENRGNDALPRLLDAARRLEPLDARLARDAYLDALTAALFAGRLASGPTVREVADAIRATPPPNAPGKGDALLDGLAVLFTEGYAPAVPLSHRAVQAFVSEELTSDEAPRFTWLAGATAAALWDDLSWDVLTGRHLETAREAGALSALPLALHTRAVMLVFTGDLGGAASLVEEARSLAEPTGGENRLVPYGEAGLVAVRGHEAEAEPLIQTWLDDAAARGEGIGVTMMQWARAALRNGLGRYREAFEAAQEASRDPLEVGAPRWALAELVEAGARCGATTAASAALEELSAMARASGTEWALGIEASRRALLRDDAIAEELYREAIERLSRTRVHLELARAQVLFGEWLRRRGRRVEARSHLRTAYNAFTAMGADAFADRAGHELLATGETVRKRTETASTDLTAQEAHIARLAARGLTNSEIGAALYISARTVEGHLRTTFIKLGVSSRRELRRALPAPG